MTLSVVIPTFNEADRIAALVSRLMELTKNDAAEIIVVDGHSTDQTAAEAERAGATVIRCKTRGRASQLHCGAERAAGNVLYFLHADSMPPASAVADILAAVAGGVQAGTFRLAFDSSHWLMRFYSWFSRFNARIFRGGDASLFITRKLYDSLGGFNTEMPIMEDIDMVLRIRARSAFVILPTSVTTSARRYNKRGMVRLQLLFAVLHLGYWVGISPNRLSEFYKNFVDL